MSSRAVHLEVANDLSSSSFINAFRRFVNRRGLPLEVFSDNGTNFTGAEKELLTAFRELNKEDVSKYMVNRKIRWHFNPPRSPHTGGVWERLVRMVKDVLKVILNNQLVNDEVLHTLLTEAESILNSRPLIPISFDPSSNEPLTPNHVLLFRPSTYATPGTFERRDNYSKRRWRQVQYLADQFWRRWCREYLPLLQCRSKWMAAMKNMTVGDVVLVAEENVPRGRWPLARVCEVYPDKKGNVRQVKVKTQNGTFLRSVAKLCKLNISKDN